MLWPQSSLTPERSVKQESHAVRKKGESARQMELVGKHFTVEGETVVVATFQNCHHLLHVFNHVHFIAPLGFHVGFRLGRSPFVLGKPRSVNPLPFGSFKFSNGEVNLRHEVIV